MSVHLLHGLDIVFVFYLDSFFKLHFEFVFVFYDLLASSNLNFNVLVVLVIYL